MSWPVELAGVVESLVTTRGPEGRWNLAALGIEPTEGEEATARTWGRTRTRRNFGERGEGYVQFTRDPVDFVEGALGIREEDSPVIDSADAWVRVGVDRAGEGREGGTEWVDWRLRPLESAVERRTVPTINRGHNAVIEATVAASRLDVPAYDTERLRARLEFFEGVVARCGGPRDRAAMDRLRELAEL